MFKLSSGGICLKIKNKFAIRLFISMLAVLILPCFVLYVVYQQSIAKSVAEEVNKMIKNEQTAAMRLLDNSLMNYQDKARFLQRSEGFQSYLYYHGFITDNNGDISSEMILNDISYTYRLSQNVDGIFIYFPNAGSVISSGMGASIATSARFFSYYYTDSSISDMEAYLESQLTFTAQRSGNLLAAQPDTSYISLIYPVHSAVQAYIVICVPEEAFSDFFNIHSESMGLTTLIFNQKGELMFSNGSDTELAEYFSQPENKIPADGLDHEIEWNNCEYLTMQTVSTQSSWQAVTFVSLDSNIYSTLFDVGNFFLIFMVLTGLVGGLLIYILVHFNYRPVQKLRQTAMDSTDASLPHAAADEFAIITNTLNHLQDENTKLNETFTSNIQAIQMTRLQRLLNDFYSSTEEFNTDCEQIGLSFSYPLFYVSVFLIPKNKRSSLEAIANQVSDELCKTMDSKYVFSVKRDQLVFIHNVSRMQDAENYEPFYAALGILNDQFAITSAVGVGHVHAGTTSLNKSLLQAVNALDYRFVKGAGTVIPYDEVSSNFNSRCPYPKQEVRKLQNVIASSDNSQIGPCIDELLHYIVAHDMPTFLARSVCADVLKALLNDSQNSIFDAYQLSEMLMQLSNAENINQLLEIINSVRKELEHPQPETPSANDNQLLNEILSYIGENYHRCDFSMQEVAIHFSMLPSNLSSFFKDNMQCTMLDYLIDLRMNLAKELLRTTTMPLQEICERVGYYNVSSFSRRFKTYEGITPNTYRFQNQ